MQKNNSNYIPFARKYRPSNFLELFGQEVLVKTLSYCIENNRLAQAHILSGIRGVGKTSSARIIAKTVNCTDLKTDQEFITPCNSCTNCTGFNNHNHPDIIEVDAASRTSVDDIREIIESCEYKPLIGKYKFFIIDEVHMLSKSAFNALLKVIEEPPEHVIFIFATTEVQKIPLTVMSRCQRYDLRRLTFEEIYHLISDIAKKESLDFEEEALKTIAIKSEGSARDAVSMIDQGASYFYNSGAVGTKVITVQTIEKMLGLLKASTVVKFAQLIIANDPSSAIKLLDEIYANAHSLEYFVEAMADFMADLSKSKVITNYHNPLYRSYLNEISDILIGSSLSRITVLWQIFSNGISEIKQSHNELITAQMLIIKAIYSCNLPTIEEILNAQISDATNLVLTNQSSPDTAIETSLDSDLCGNQVVEEKFFDFLKYCHKANEIGTYYTLLNNIEVEEFANNQMKIAGSLNNSAIKAIETLLQKWSNQLWKVELTHKQNITSVKDQMLKKVKQTGDYQLIKDKFPDANIVDIILKS